MNQNEKINSLSILKVSQKYPIYIDMKAYFSIRYKFLFVTTLLLLLCVSAYLFMATKVFKQDKTELVFDYNRNIVTTLNSDISNLIDRVHDRIELFPYFDSKKQLTNFVKENSDIAYLAKSQSFEAIDEVLFSDKKFIKNYNIADEAELSKFITKKA